MGQARVGQAARPLQPLLPRGHLEPLKVRDGPRRRRASEQVSKPALELLPLMRHGRARQRCRAGELLLARRGRRVWRRRRRRMGALVLVAEGQGAGLVLVAEEVEGCPAPGAV